MAKNKKKINWKSKKTWKNVLIIGLAVITLVGAIVGLSALFRKSEETTKEINPTYAIGGLTEQGAYLETEESIYTEDAFECQGLDIELDFKSNVSYRVFFYDGENDFVSATSKLTKNYDETTTPERVKTARIVITPNDDTEIKWYEKSGYANQLTITVNKEQNYVDPFTIDLFAVDTNMIGQMYTGAVGSELSVITHADYGSCQKINVENIEQLKFVYDDDATCGVYLCLFIDADGLVIYNNNPQGDLTYTKLDVPDGAVEFVCAYKLGEEFVINQSK